MAEQNMEMGRAIYESLCNVLDKMGVHYKKVEEDLVIAFGYKGEDMNHDLIIAVNVKQEVIQLMERLPYEITAEKATEMACAVCYVNNQILSGQFTYNMKDRLSFEVTQIFTGSLIGEEALHRMIMTLIITVENYDDKFMALNKGYLKVEDFARND